MIADDRPLYVDEETGTINMDIVKKQFMTPIPIAAPRFWRGANVGPIACGGRHLLILVAKRGRTLVYAAGLNSHGQLGLGGDHSRQDELVQVCALIESLRW